MYHMIIADTFFLSHVQIFNFYTYTLRSSFKTQSLPVWLTQFLPGWLTVCCPHTLWFLCII